MRRTLKVLLSEHPPKVVPNCTGAGMASAGLEVGRAGPPDSFGWPLSVLSLFNACGAGGPQELGWKPVPRFGTAARGHRRGAGGALKSLDGKE